MFKLGTLTCDGFFLDRRERNNFLIRIMHCSFALCLYLLIGSFASALSPEVEQAPKSKLQVDQEDSITIFFHPNFDVPPMRIDRNKISVYELLEHVNDKVPDSSPFILRRLKIIFDRDSENAKSREFYFEDDNEPSEQELRDLFVDSDDMIFFLDSCL